MAAPFADLPKTAATHFKLHFYGAVLLLRDCMRELDRELLEFLSGYRDELTRLGFAEDTPGGVARWRDAVQAWEGAVSEHLPVRAVRDGAGLDDVALSLLFTIGLCEEDARFGTLFDALQGGTGARRPTAGLLGAWWHGQTGTRDALGTLCDGELVVVADSSAPRSEWTLRAARPLWEALRGEHGLLGPSLRHRPAATLARLDDLVLGEGLATTARRVPALLAGPSARAVIVRGPRAAGRRTLCGAIARALGRGVVEVGDPRDGDGLGPLATALAAMPVIALDPGPGQVAEAPVIHGYRGPVGIVLGPRGGVSGATVDGALTLRMPVPGRAERARHWAAALDAPESGHAEALAADLRLTGGTIRRLARLARTEAALHDRVLPSREDVRGAARTMHGQELDTLARHVPTAGDWSDLAVAAETAEELYLLERRCRNRERLAGVIGAATADQLGAGVRALFSGPSGTGKSLAARLLASVLGRDLYALDLSTVVDKYIGETEKNLDAVFSRAEELDVVLLLDEGDALMTRRTDVQSSNDRYANLETNYLLQRIESYDGILVVTTNAGDRIDAAFRRRIDVVVDFRRPDPGERRSIWDLHLPARNAVAARLLDDIASRCELTGGQIRNAALHATLLALDDGGTIGCDHVEEAVRREYRKTGSVCPIRVGAH